MREGRFLRVGRYLNKEEILDRGKILDGGRYLTEGINLTEGRFLTVGRYLTEGRYLREGRYLTEGKYLTEASRGDGGLAKLERSTSPSLINLSSDLGINKQTNACLSIHLGSTVYNCLFCRVASFKNTL